jgi:acetyltransferase EpsM
MIYLPWKERIAIIGGGGHAKEVYHAMGDDRARFFVDEEYSGGDLLPIRDFNHKRYKAIVAIGNSSDRHGVVMRMPKGTRYFSFIHPSVIMIGRSRIGQGVFIGPGCVITCDVSIGHHSIINRSVHVSHGCMIESFSSIMPGTMIGGDVQVCEGAYIGASVSIKEKIKIGQWSVVGMGSVVINDVLASSTYVGVPAKKIK